MSEETKDFALKNGAETDKKSGTNTGHRTKATQMPQMNFATFIVSLNHSALVHLGLVEDPSSGTKAKNLELAKQTIDIIAMLEEKTKGNLTNEESKITENLLYDLRMLYIKETRP